MHAKFGAYNTILEKFRGRIEILNTYNFLCWKFAWSAGKLQLLVPPFLYFLHVTFLM